VVLSAGTLVAGYRIEKVLGSGGMGTVYLAANPVLPRSDALKVLSSELSQDPPFRARFIREADLAATLDHPNIVTVYTRGETDEGQLWIAMQYVAGSDANNELSEGRMTPKRAVHIVVEVAKALDHAHRRNLIHRDIKPANFLLAAQDERVMLADFGIARALDESVGLTATGTVMATVAYAAPETLSGDHVDRRADIYALACSLYRMLTGKAPFASSGGMAATMAAHLSAPPPRVTDQVAALPPAIDDVIAKAMAKNPDERYQSAGEFAQAATVAIEEGVTRPVRTVGPPGQQRPPTAQQPWATHYSSPAEPSPVADPITYPSGYFSAPQARQPPADQSGAARQLPPPRGLRPDERPGHQAPAQPRRQRAWWIGAAVAAVVLIVAGGLTALLRGGGSSSHEFQPQSFSHVHGTTQIDTEPHAVAALGPGDGEAVLSLNVQPVVLAPPGGAQLPSWEQQLVTGNPKLLSSVDTDAVAAAKPDVIVDTGDIDDATYAKLAAIAPTVTRPQDKAGPVWTWQNQLSWVGRILGRDDTATQLIDRAKGQQDQIRSQNPAFDGKGVAAVNVTDSDFTVSLRVSNLTAYLEGLGFRYNDKFQRATTDTGNTRPITDINLYQVQQTDVLVVIRTDKAAGGGGYNGLPKQLTTYRGAMVIVDDPNVIAALDTGGYAATEYLDSTFVPTLAQQVH
jgi:serine/threonine-protein kinase